MKHKILRILFWVSQIFYLLLASIVPVLAWMNKLQFRVGVETKGKIAVTTAMAIVFVSAEFAVWWNRKQYWNWNNTLNPKRK